MRHTPGEGAPTERSNDPGTIDGRSWAVKERAKRPSGPLLAAAAPAVTAAYLGVGAVPLVAGGWSAQRAGILVAHLLALVACAALAIRRWRQAEEAPDRRVSLADWLPIALVPFLYWELPHLSQVWTTGYHDQAILALEAALFPGDLATNWAGELPLPVVSEALHLAYLGFYPMIFGPPLVLHLTGRRGPFERTLFAVALTFAVCFAVFIAFPVQGPRFLGAGPPGIPDGPVRRLVLHVLEAGSSRGTAFPSSHVAVAVAQSVVAVRLLPRLAPALWVVTFGLAAGAIYGGFHYAVDVALGAAVGAGAGALALRVGGGR